MITGSVGVHLLDNPGNLDCAVGVGQPVQVNPYGARLQFGEEGGDVEARVVHHAQREVDDAHAQPTRLR